MIVRSQTKIQSRIERRRRAECASLCGTSPNSQRSSFAAFRPSFEAEVGKRSSNSPSVSSSPRSHGRDADPESLRPRCRRSFVDSQTRTAGVPAKSGLNSRSLGSRSASPLSLDTYQSAIRTMINANGGGRSFAITGIASPRWTSWSFRPLGSGYCMPGSSSITGGERSSISGLLSTRHRPGSFSISAKHSPMTPLHGSSSTTTIPSSQNGSLSLSGTFESNRNGRHSEARGRMGSPRDGSGVHAENYSIT